MNTEDHSIRRIIDAFEFPGVFSHCEEVKTGHINSTYRLTFAQPDGGVRRYILQRINTFAFKKPVELMQNVMLVTEHLRQALIARGQDPDGRVLRVIPTRAQGVLLDDGQGGSWRAYDYIENAVCRDRVESPEQFREIGRAFGEFQNMLADFPIERLYDTIPDFHDTRKRLENFERSVQADAVGRAGRVGGEIAFVRARHDAMCRIVDMIKSGRIPLRVTHNDTKINNVMLDRDTGLARCVIDLDTVMAGSALYDFGDAIRYGASTAAEDEENLDNVALDMTLYQTFSDGFISQTWEGLTRRELEELPLGALVMTFEVGLRFLTDYLDGDTYFRVEKPDHNLVRARAQFRLLEDMEAHIGDMSRINAELIQRYASGAQA